MTYSTHRYGFDSLRILAAGIYVPGVATTAVVGNLQSRRGTMHHMVVELPQSAAQTMTVEFYDIDNINLIGTSTPVLILRPWGAVTQGSYTVPIHRNFMRGIVVQTNNNGGLIALCYGPSGSRMGRNVDNFIQRF